jgi:hypothetical protein
MTRINVGIPPAKLTRQHLIAEHRELVRIPNAIKSGRAVVKGIPEQFKLGSGHVKFFYNKLKYLHKRYDALYKECIRRGYKMTYFGDSFKELPQILYNDYIPTQKDIEIITERINSRGGNL